MISRGTTLTALLSALLLGVAGFATTAAAEERPARIAVAPEVLTLASGLVAERPVPRVAPRLLHAPYRGPVEIRMMVIHATNSADGFDPPIRHLARHLNFLNYKGFRLLFKNEMMLRAKATRSLGLFEGKVIEVTLNSATQEKVVLHIKMYNPKVPKGVSLDTTVSVERRGTFFVGGPRHLDGVLLLPITAWY